jgi:hypothetical protein
MHLTVPLIAGTTVALVASFCASFIQPTHSRTTSGIVEYRSAGCELYVRVEDQGTHPAGMPKEVATLAIGHGLFRAGFPFRAAESTLSVSKANMTANEGLILDRNRFFIIPLRLRWRGFLGNCSVYVAFAFAVSLSSRYVHRLWRRANNRCQKCGYSLIGLPGVPCPECGTDRQPVRGPRGGGPAGEPQPPRAERPGRETTVAPPSGPNAISELVGYTPGEQR